MHVSRMLSYSLNLCLGGLVSRRVLAFGLMRNLEASNLQVKLLIFPSRWQAFIAPRKAALRA